MSDLVKRLRAHSMRVSTGVNEDCEQAAALIERQAALLAGARADLKALLEAPMIDHSNADRSVYGIAKAAIAKLEANSPENGLGRMGE